MLFDCFISWFLLPYITIRQSRWNQLNQSKKCHVIKISIYKIVLYKLCFDKKKCNSFTYFSEVCGSLFRRPISWLRNLWQSSSSACNEVLVISCKDCSVFSSPWRSVILFLYLVWTLLAWPSLPTWPALRWLDICRLSSCITLFISCLKKEK